LASGEIRVSAAGAETGNKKRDRTMHGKVLESERYPLFVFRAEKLEGTIPDAGAADVEIRGVLSMRGAEHSFVLPARVEIEGDRVHATSTFVVPYVEWGLHDPSFLFLRVAKEVQILVSATGNLTAPDAATHAEAR
jgi:polyisoprenoid-binding protein YceI